MVAANQKCLLFAYAFKMGYKFASGDVEKQTNYLMPSPGEQYSGLFQTKSAQKPIESP